MTSLSETLQTDEAFKKRLADLKTALIVLGPDFGLADAQLAILLDDLARVFQRLDRARRQCIGRIEEILRLTEELNALPGEHPLQPTARN
jgi:hypothetical protein